MMDRPALDSASRFRSLRGSRGPTCCTCAPSRRLGPTPKSSNESLDDCPRARTAYGFRFEPETGDLTSLPVDAAALLVVAGRFIALRLRLQAIERT